VNIEIINTGSELLLGRVLNTHQQWLCRRLADLGYRVNRQTCVADNGPSIETAVRESLGRSPDLVITTGGLGPTSDDITRELIARILGRKLILDQRVKSQIDSYFLARQRVAPPKSEVQAMVPEGALVLPNANGTAPGLAIELNPNPFSPEQKNACLVLLPGPPRELHPMFLDTVVPLLRRQLPLQQAFVCRTLRTTGLGESLVENKIAAPLDSLVKAGLEIGYCARIGEVDVRLAARGANAAEIVKQGEDLVAALLGEIIYGREDETLEAVLVRQLTEQGKTVALAESCTGGITANRLTAVPGASAVFAAGLVTYSNEAKKSILGVKQKTLTAKGAVSEETAREMAEGARKTLETDYALSITGIAGPSGGSAAKPVGTVFIGLASKEGTTVQRQFNNFDRETFKYVTSQQALNLLRLALV
jgi:nicotinamide-nucleotide amidase